MASTDVVVTVVVANYGVDTSSNTVAIDVAIGLIGEVVVSIFVSGNVVNTET